MPRSKIGAPTFGLDSNSPSRNAAARRAFDGGLSNPPMGDRRSAVFEQMEDVVDRPVRITDRAARTSRRYELAVSDQHVELLADRPIIPAAAGTEIDRGAAYLATTRPGSIGSLTRATGTDSANGPRVVDGGAA